MNLSDKSFSGTINAKVITGQIHLQNNNFIDEDITLKITTGKINVSLPKESSFKLESSIVTGDIKCDFPVLVSESTKKKRLNGEVNKALNGRVKLSAITGMIKIIQQ